MKLLSLSNINLTTALLALALCANDAVAMNNWFSSCFSCFSCQKKQPTTSAATALLGKTKAIAPLTESRGKKLKKLLYDELDPMPPELIAIIVEYENYELQGKCFNTRTKHTAEVTCVIQLTNGRYKDYIASCSYDGTIKIWDPETGACVKTLNLHARLVLCLIQLADGRYKDHIASGSYDGAIRIWDLTADEKSSCVKTLTSHTGCVRCLIQLTNGWLASGSSGNTISLWDTESGECVKTLNDSGAFSLLQLADGQLAAGSWDDTIKIWDLTIADEKEACVTILQMLMAFAGCLTQLANGYLVAGLDDGEIILWK